MNFVIAPQIHDSSCWQRGM